MISAPSILLLGAAGRNSGKTTFACALIERLSKEGPIVAAKVTTIRERDGTCPRGGEGCGVCAAFKDRYDITEETVCGGTKDTQRLLASGAAQVYWLRVLKEHLEEGAAALLERIGPDLPVVCESNSLRHVLAPGLFLQFRPVDMQTVKTSARAVQPYADHEVVWDGAQFDIPPSEVEFDHNQWMLYGAAKTSNKESSRHDSF
jgi:hypothetical protein